MDVQRPKKTIRQKTKDKGQKLKLKLFEVASRNLVAIEWDGMEWDGIGMDGSFIRRHKQVPS